MTKQTAPWVYTFLYDLQPYLNVKRPAPTAISRPFTTSCVLCREMRHHTCQLFLFWHHAQVERSSVLPEFAVVTLEKLLHSLSVKREVHFLWQPGNLLKEKAREDQVKEDDKSTGKRIVHKRAEKAFLGLFTTLGIKLMDLSLCWKVRWTSIWKCYMQPLPWLWKNTQTYMCVLHLQCIEGRVQRVFPRFCGCP